MRRFKARTLDQLLFDEGAYGSVEVEPGLTVTYDHEVGDYWAVVEEDGTRRITDTYEVVLEWVGQPQGSIAEDEVQ